MFFINSVHSVCHSPDCRCFCWVAESAAVVLPVISCWRLDDVLSFAFWTPIIDAVIQCYIFIFFRFACWKPALISAGGCVSKHRNKQQTTTPQTLQLAKSASCQLAQLLSDTERPQCDCRCGRVWLASSAISSLSCRPTYEYCRWLQESENNVRRYNNNLYQFSVQLVLLRK